MNFSQASVAFLLAASLGTGFAQGPVPVDDETIFQHLEDALRRAPSLATAHIRVQVREGVVTLSGSASTIDDVSAAGRLAWRVRGVSGVQNDVRIARRPAGV